MRRVYGRQPLTTRDPMAPVKYHAMNERQTTRLIRRPNSRRATQTMGRRAMGRRIAVRAWMFAATVAVLTLPVVAQATHVGSASFRQVRCLAQNIYFEARGESLLGQLGVAHVVMNRVDDREFPATICDVVKEGGPARRGACQFSWWCDGESDRPTDLVAWKQSFKVALQTYFGQTIDPTRGALWYHADYVQPAWRHNYVLGPRIGRHLFYWRGAAPV